jgi:hypothetical protein
MIIHTDSDNRKPIEQKVRELIFTKLYFKIDKEQIFIDIEDFINLILMDVIAIAKSGYDIDKALKIALKEQPHYNAAPQTKRNELEEAAEQFAIEVDAYYHYLDAKKEQIDDDTIYDAVSFILNSDDKLLTKRLQEIFSEALALFITEEVAVAKQTSRELLISTYAHYVKLIAANDTIDDAVDELYYANEEFFIKNNLKKELSKLDLEQTATVFKDEISAYKFAISLQNQNADIGTILGTVKQLLQLS